MKAILEIELPECCCDCPCAREDYCAVNGKYPTFDEWYNARPEWCPLVVVQEHGRLIDADAQEGR